REDAGGQGGGAGPSARRGPSAPKANPRPPHTGAELWHPTAWSAIPRGPPGDRAAPHGSKAPPRSPAGSPPRQAARTASPPTGSASSAAAPSCWPGSDPPADPQPTTAGTSAPRDILNSPAPCRGLHLV